MTSVTRDDMRDLFDDMKQYMSAELNGRFAEQNSWIEKRFAEQDEKLDEILNAVGEDLAKPYCPA